VPAKPVKSIALRVYIRLSQLGRLVSANYTPIEELCPNLLHVYDLFPKATTLHTTITFLSEHIQPVFIYIYTSQS
jgi:hypothetical protein